MSQKELAADKKCFCLWFPCQLYQGSLKDAVCPFETWLSTKIKGNHHIQGNVQVYNVRISAYLRPIGRPICRPVQVLLHDFPEFLSDYHMAFCPAPGKLVHGRERGTPPSPPLGFKYGLDICFHLLKNTFVYFPLLILKGVYDYWKCCVFFPGDLSKWHLEAWDTLFGGFEARHKFLEAAMPGQWNNHLYRSDLPRS